MGKALRPPDQFYWSDIQDEGLDPIDSYACQIDSGYITAWKAAEYMDKYFTYDTHLHPDLDLCIVRVNHIDSNNQARAYAYAVQSSLIKLDTCWRVLWYYREQTRDYSPLYIALRTLGLAEI